MKKGQQWCIDGYAIPIIEEPQARFNNIDLSQSIIRITEFNVIELWNNKQKHSNLDFDEYLKIKNKVKRIVNQCHDNYMEVTQ